MLVVAAVSLLAVLLQRNRGYCCVSSKVVEAAVTGGLTVESADASQLCRVGSALVVENDCL